jgi:hypothetical protein
MDALMIAFLRWIEERPRTYQDVMAAWRSHCPRHTIWEDALIDGLVTFEHGGSGVRLTDKGRRAMGPAD